LKKFLLALGVVLTFALLLGAAAYVLLFMEDPVQEGRGESISVAEKVSKPKNADVRDQAETQADILEMLAHGWGDVHLPDGSAQGRHQLPGIAVGALAGAKARHG